MFPALVDTGRKEDIHVVWNREGELVGATVAALPRDGQADPMHQCLAWPITLGEFMPRKKERRADSRLTLRCYRLCRRCSLDERIRGRSSHGRFCYSELDRSWSRWVFHRLGGYGWILREVWLQEMGEGVLWGLDVSSAALHSAAY